MARANSSEVLSLFQNIVDKSSGVFLWVILVVKALRTAARNFDSIADLRKRVDELPADIDKLYSSMLAKMDQIYRRQASMLLQIMYQSTRVAHKEPMTTVRLSFAMDGDIDAAIDIKITPLTSEERSKRCRTIGGIIRSRCCGLLEVHAATQGGPAALLEANLVANRHSRAAGLDQYLHVFDVGDQTDENQKLNAWHKLFDAGINLLSIYDDESRPQVGVSTRTNASAEPREEVQFLHKSVVDFLEQPQVWMKLQNSLLATPDFDANVSTVVASLDDMKHWSYHFECGAIHCDSMFSVGCLFGLRRYVEQTVMGSPASAAIQPEPTL